MGPIYFDCAHVFILNNFVLEKMTESAHDFDILMNDGSTRSMSHYKEKFSFDLFRALES